MYKEFSWYFVALCTARTMAFKCWFVCKWAFSLQTWLWEACASQSITLQVVCHSRSGKLQPEACLSWHTYRTSWGLLSDIGCYCSVGYCNKQYWKVIKREQYAFVEPSSLICQRATPETPTFCMELCNKHSQEFAISDSYEKWHFNFNGNGSVASVIEDLKG